MGKQTNTFSPVPEILSGYRLRGLKLWCGESRCADGKGIQRKCKILFGVEQTCGQIAADTANFLCFCNIMIGIQYIPDVFAVKRRETGCEFFSWVGNAADGNLLCIP